MAAPGSKIVFSFHDNLGGITDTWYTLTNPASSVPFATLANYVQYRLGISGAQTVFDKIRVSTIGAARQTSVYFPSQLPAGSATSGFFAFRTGARRTIDQSDAPFTAILMNKLSGTTSGRIFFRGGPDELSVLGGMLLSSAEWTMAFNNYVNAVMANAFGWVAVQAPVNGPQNILSAVAQPDGTILFTLAGPLFVAPFNSVRAQVRVRRCTSPSWLNGGLTVTPLTATTCLSIRQTPVVGFQPGQAQMYVPNRSLFLQTTAMNCEEIRSRKAGRPFGLFRGRSKARVPV
jgi:hypothetical protein